MSGFALRYVRQNFLFGAGGEVAALYRLGLVSYAHLPDAGKWALLRRLERLACAAGADLSLWRVNRAYPAERYPQELGGAMDARGQDPAAWRAFLDGHRTRLAELSSHIPEVYLAVSLEEPAGGRWHGLVGAGERARRRVARAARGRGPSRLTAAELGGLAMAEQRVFERLRAVVEVRRASTREIQWLLRRAACRGITEPALDGHWRPDALVVRTEDGSVAYEPLERDVWRCCNAPVTEPAQGPARLVVEGEDATSQQALLCVGALPDEAQFPGPSAELLFAPLEALAFPVDAVFHGRWVANREALSQVRKRILDVEHAYRERAAGSLEGPGLWAEEERALAREYEAILQGSSRPPMLYGWFSLALGAPDGEELERRVQALRDAYGDVALHRPRGLQHQLFWDHLPRADGGSTPDYVAQLTVEQLAATVPIATQQVGSPQGIYLGWTPAGGGRPVCYDPTAAPRQSRTSAVLLAGALGSGKTLAAQLIAYGAERRGSLVIDFDPKPDHGLDRIPALSQRVQVLELTAAEAQRGCLDPLAIGLDDLREELACSYYLELLRDPPAAWENAIQRAVRDIARTRRGGSLAVIDALRRAGGSAAAEAADALEVTADFGLARLGFGAHAEPIGEAHAPMTTIRTVGLTLPDPRAARDTYTRAERASVATLSLLAAYALRLVAADRSRHKLVLLDEAWFLLASPQGRAVIDRLVRLGRAFNTTVLLVTQRLEDIGDLSDLVGTYLIFGQESDAEASRALAMLGLDAQDPQRLAHLRELRAGRCLMRDLDGRVGEVQIDPVDPQLLAALDTTPREAPG